MKRFWLAIIFFYLLYTFLRHFSIRTGLKAVFLLMILLIGSILIREIQDEYFEKLRSKNNTYFEALKESIGSDEIGDYRHTSNQWGFQFLNATDNHHIGYGQVEVLGEQVNTFITIIDEISRAQHHIHMEYFIVRNDKIGEKLKNVLIEKSKQGVEVRFIYDGFGSFLISKQFVQELEKAGVQLIRFSPVSQGIKNFNLNHRNHRKILIIDGKLAVIGGSNIGDEYLGRDEKIGKWRDMDILIRGDGVRAIQAAFLRNWYIAKHEMIVEKIYFREPQEKGNIPMEILSGEPLTEINSIEHFFLSMIYSAKNYLYFTTPYFIPPDSVLLALESAAARGVKVKLMIPDRSDNIVAEYATNLYAQKMLKDGIEVYRYKEGFLHSKTAIMDGKISTVGTANMDHRGLRLDYEILTVMYDSKTAEVMEHFFLRDIDKSIAMERNKGMRFTDKIGYQLVRLIRGVL
ncbi:cardiolipin synthase [Geosporobacter subterraneus DSM 17957]|uniref:Cardiolipin synthase n=1 Tax=Geosporobacter subterraneus DSM 17957 TaxID=1121919 RepID=A0A1M6N5T8_9FIRM|nr:cardiolipin synthase [Geosporobacter subterraneus]SHJ91040.1 cardiolipin synthase [Geosporobacter subterraneus DSM 17957]